MVCPRPISQQQPATTESFGSSLWPSHAPRHDFCCEPLWVGCRHTALVASIPGTHVAFLTRLWLLHHRTHVVFTRVVALSPFCRLVSSVHHSGWIGYVHTPRFNSFRTPPPPPRKNAKRRTLVATGPIPSRKGLRSASCATREAGGTWSFVCFVLGQP